MVVGLDSLAPGAAEEAVPPAGGAEVDPPVPPLPPRPAPRPPLPPRLPLPLLTST